MWNLFVQIQLHNERVKYLVIHWNAYMLGGHQQILWYIYTYTSGKKTLQTAFNSFSFSFSKYKFRPRFLFDCHILDAIYSESSPRAMYYFKFAFGIHLRRLMTEKRGVKRMHQHINKEFDAWRLFDLLTSLNCILMCSTIGRFLLMPFCSCVRLLTLLLCCVCVFFHGSTSENRKKTHSKIDIFWFVILK